MGEKEDEHSFVGRGSDDCMTISASHCSVSARTQLNDCRQASLRLDVKAERPYVRESEHRAKESIKNEFGVVDGKRSVQGPQTKDSRLLDNGAVNGYKNSVLSRGENRTPDFKEKFVAASLRGTCRCNVISRNGTKELTENHEAKRKFRFYRITPKPFVADSTSPTVNKVVQCQPSVANTGGRGAICTTNNCPNIDADNRDLSFPNCHCDRRSLISDEASSIEQTNSTSEPLCDVAFSEEPSIREADLNTETEKGGDGDPTTSPFAVTTDGDVGSVHTHASALTDSINIEVLPVTLSVESENSAEFQPSVTDESLTYASNPSSTQSYEKPVDQDGRTTVRSSQGEMGNTPLRRLYREEHSGNAAISKQSAIAATPYANSKLNSEIDQKQSSACPIPELIVSDSSMDQEFRAVSVHESGKEPQAEEDNETTQDPEASNKEKPQLRAYKSSDSAYSSDSRCTSMDSASYAVNRTEDVDDGEQDTSSLLSPPSITLDSKSSSSSSSSSCSSPSHSAIAGGASDSTLRVISEYGMQRKLSSSSGSSFRSSLSFESEDDMLSSDGEIRDQVTVKGRRQSKAQSSWTKIRRMVIWSPFMQSFKKKYPWVQLAGHAGNFQPGEEGCILKKYCVKEADCLSRISTDAHLKTFAPHYHGLVDKDGERYTRMQDLLLAYDCPSVMDCKMGVRTYLEDELVKAKIKPRLRHDMYMKMTEISPGEPTPEEHEAKAVTKPRYMQWREHVSSSSNLGFRIEGIKKADNEPSKDYKLTKTKEQIKKAFKYFIDNKLEVLKKYIARLKDVRAAAEKSEFFMTHEVIGSSLLFVHDSSGIASAWMIDFGKTTQVPENKCLSHRAQWVEGNREDGYLFGLDNLIDIFEEILLELSTALTEENSETAEKTTINNNTDSQSHANELAEWALQSSGESGEYTPLESPPVRISDVSFDDSTPRKPTLRRQVATTNSYDDTPKYDGDQEFVFNHAQNDSHLSNADSHVDPPSEQTNELHQANIDLSKT